MTTHHSHTGDPRKEPGSQRGPNAAGSEWALRESDALARAILATTVDGIITIDAQGHVETFNPAAERIFGYDAAEVIGKNVHVLMPEPYHSEHDGYIQAYHQTGRRRIIGIGREVTGRRKDGSTFPMDLAVSEVALPGGGRIFTGLVRDISGRRELEQEAASLLAAQGGLNFIGFVEGGDIYRGVADVVVCDGFTGNVLLKASEGAAGLLQSTLKSAFQSSVMGRVAGWLARPALSVWSDRYNPARLNGATFLGLNGVVVKSHGGASEEGFVAALQVAHEQATHQITAAIAKAVAV